MPALTGDETATLAALLAAGERALFTDGALDAGRDNFEAAFRAADEADDADAMAAAALGLAELRLQGQPGFSAAVVLRERLRRSLAQVDPDGPRALRLRIRLAAEEDYERGEHAGVLAGLAQARAASDPVAEADALGLLHQCLATPDHTAWRERLAAELVAASARTGRYRDLLTGLLYQAADLLEQPGPRFGRRLAELRERLAERDHLAARYAADCLDVTRAVRAGQLDRAEQLAADGRDTGLAAGDASAPSVHVGQLLGIRWYQGRIADLRPALAVAADSPALEERNHGFTATQALVEAATGGGPKAAAILAALGAPALAALPRSGTWLVTMYTIVETARLIDDRETAAAARALLLPFAEHVLAGPRGMLCFGSVHHALGVAALATGDLDSAVADFGRAVRRNLALPHWPAVLASRRALAQALFRRGRPGDRAAADEQLALAEEEAQAVRAEAPQATPAPVASPATVACTRQGIGWRVALGGRQVLAGPGVGLQYLAALLARPAQEIPALDLVTGLGRPAGTAMTRETGRPPGDEKERARIAAGKAIRRAIAQIADRDAEIGQYLKQTVHTGNYCAYWPA